MSERGLRCLLWRCELDPGGRVIARVFAATHLAIDPGSDKALRQRRAQQQMVDAQTGIAGKGVPEIVPESIDALARM